MNDCVCPSVERFSCYAIRYGLNILTEETEDNEGCCCLCHDRFEEEDLDEYEKAAR